MRSFKMLIVYISIVFPILASCLILIMSGYVSLFYNGFAIDSSGVLYLGKATKIEKYTDAMLIEEISPKTSRGYAFTIQNDDTILLSTATTVYTLDLHGNVISKETDIGTNVFNQLQKGSNNFTTRAGETYFQKSKWGRIQIVSENGSVIYLMPVLDYIVKLVLFLVGVSFVIFVPLILRKFRFGSFQKKPEPMLGWV